MSLWSVEQRFARRAVWVALLATLVLVGATLAAPSAFAGTLTYEACGSGSQYLFGVSEWDWGYTLGTSCPSAGGVGPHQGIYIDANGNAAGGHMGQYRADAPAGIALTEIDVTQMTVNWGSGSGYAANFYSQNSASSPYFSPGWTSYGYFFAPSSYAGWQLKCNASSGCNTTGYVAMYNVFLTAQESATPPIAALGADNLHNYSGWVHGAGFGIGLEGSDPSGLCNMRAWLNGNLIQGPTTTANTSVWNQCDPSGALQQWAGPDIDTARYPDGTALKLAYQADDAAGNWTTSSTSTSYVDNSPVTLSLRSPNGSHEAPTTAGTQYLTATATSGPSGIGAIYCSQNGGASWASEPLTGVGSQTATTRVPVSGLGGAVTRCYAANRALGSDGQPATSPAQTWALKLGEPVRAGITFGRVIEHCHRVIKRELPGRWVRVRRHHKWVRVHTAGHARKEHVLACHVVMPDRHDARVPFGHRVTVSGWLAADGIALSHVPVRVLAAVDDGRYRWRTIALATTSADGRWSTRLRAGPSRQITAVYGGGPITLSATSRRAQVAVSAGIVLDQVPSHVSWGGALVIRGRVLGGSIPGRPPEQILQLQSGVGRHLQVVGNPTIDRDGRFVITIQASGSGAPLRTQIAIATLHEANYPYAPGVSRRVSITIG